jgi:hypothetical protein
MGFFVARSYLQALLIAPNWNGPKAHFLFWKRVLGGVLE